MTVPKNVLVEYMIDALITLPFIDYVVIGSDSGRITILEYIPSRNTFERVIDDSEHKILVIN